MKKLLFPLFIFLLSFSALSQNGNNNDLVKTDTIGKGSSFQFIGIPIAFYTPETGFGFGGGGQMFFLGENNRFNNRVSNILFSGIYTLNEQLMIEITPQIYFGRGNYFLDMKYALQIYPNLFWGIGNTTPESNEEVYNQTTHALEVAFMKRLPPDLNFGFQLYYQNHQVTEVTQGGLLDSGTILGGDRTVISGLGAVFNYDTRDKTGSPNKGFFYQAKARFSSKIFGSTQGFNTFIVDLREYAPLNNQSLLAFQIYFEGNYGDVPFQGLAAYGGGSRARGYFFGRYLDKQMFVLQTEYRWKFKERWTLNAFGLVGKVAPNTSELVNFQNLRPGLGFGTRFKLFKDKDTWLRFDYGSGIDGNSGIYFGINEAF